jgi:hypothetical protein
MRSASLLSPIFASVMRTDSTSTYDPVAPAMDTYPFVLEIVRDPDAPLWLSEAVVEDMEIAPVESRLLTVVAPAPQRTGDFDVAAPPCLQRSSCAPCPQQSPHLMSV